MNGSTNEDHTNYFEIMPSNQLDLLLFLESDRMRSLDITSENLANQRNAVQEERRQSLDNQPYGRADEVMQELLYDNFAYKHSTIGSMEDLNAATIGDVKEFFRTYYAPNNAVLTLIGDFKTDDAVARISKFFGGIPRQPDPPTIDMTEPVQGTERRASVDDPLARLPRVEIAYKAVPGNSPDFYALRILSSVLEGGQSSRLFQKLLKEKEAVVSVGGSVISRRGTGALYVSATLKSGQKIEDIEAAIFNEIEHIKKESITEPELAKAKSIQRRVFTNTTQNSLSVAVLLGALTTDFGDPGLINLRLDRYSNVTVEDVQRVANKYLTQNNRTVVITRPKPKRTVESESR